MTMIDCRGAPVGAVAGRLGSILYFIEEGPAPVSYGRCRRKREGVARTAGVAGWGIRNGYIGRMRGCVW